MKLVTIIATLAILCSALIAQQPQPAPQSPSAPSRSGVVAPSHFDSPALPENYLITLTITEKEQVVTEFTLMVATADFKTDFADAKFTMTSFIGNITLEEGGTVLVRYGIGNEVPVPVQIGERQSVQYKLTATQSSVRLRLGEAVQIIKSDMRSCRLSISRFANQESKPK